MQNNLTILFKKKRVSLRIIFNKFWIVCFFFLLYFNPILLDQLAGAEEYTDSNSAEG